MFRLTGSETQLLLWQFADWFTTAVGIEAGLTEANKILAFLAGYLPLIGLLAFKLIMATAIIMIARVTNDTWGIWFSNLVMFGVCLWNVTLTVCVGMGL